MKTIGIFTSEQGHESIAKAIEGKILANAGDRYRVKVFFYKQPMKLLYKSIYRVAPKTLGRPFQLTTKLMEEVDGIDQVVKKYFKIHVKNKVCKFVKENKIDLSISTHLMYNSTLVDIQKELEIPFLNIITDPRTIHSIIFSKKAKNNFIFNEEIPKYYLENYSTKVSGWFIQKKFEENYQKDVLKKKLKITKGQNFLIASGSDGSNMVLKILPTIINCPNDCNFFIACGSNESLYKSVEGIKKTIEKLSSSKAKIIPLRFTTDLHQYMQIADMVIGKAGPNTLFESVATETPFFAITHIHGQENGNLDLIEEYGLGIVEERSKEANKKLLDLIKNPRQIKKFEKSIKKMKAYNQKSINILIKEIDKELKK